MDQDDRPKPKHIHVLGENLETVSIEELRLRVNHLQMEIARIESEITRKESSRTAAEAFFKS